MNLVAIVSALALTAVSLPTLHVEASAGFLQKIPNGSSLGQAVGHVGTTAEPNEFGKAFAGAQHQWTVELCKKECPVRKMTYGEMFGDPCCEWKEGQKPAFEVTKLEEKPKKHVCEKKSASASGGGDYGEENPAPKPEPTKKTPKPTSAKPKPTPKKTDKSKPKPPKDDEHVEFPVPKLGNKTTLAKEDCKVDTDEEEEAPIPPPTETPSDY